jgi:hypothetical protein
MHAISHTLRLLRTGNYEETLGERQYEEVLDIDPALVLSVGPIKYGERGKCPEISSLRETH